MDLILNLDQWSGRSRFTQFIALVVILFRAWSRTVRVIYVKGIKEKI